MFIIIFLGIPFGLWMWYVLTKEYPERKEPDIEVHVKVDTRKKPRSLW